MRTFLHSPPILFGVYQLAYEAYFFALVLVVTSKHGDNHTTTVNCPSHTVNHQQTTAQCGQLTLQG